MNRRDANKLLAALGIGALTPTNLLSQLDNNRIHFIGLGTSGMHILEYFQSKKEEGIYTCINDCSPGENVKNINFIEFVSPKITLRPPERKVTSITFIDGIEISTEYIDKEGVYSSDMKQELVLTNNIKTIFKNKQHKYILLSSLGGYTGTYLTEQLIELLSTTHKYFYTICTAPFAFEGQEKTDQANRMKSKFGGYQNFKIFNLDSLMSIIGNVTLDIAFDHANREFYNMYRKI